MIKNIAILGCGWLGLPLAKELLQTGYLVNGSTTSEEKMMPLALAGINPFLIAVHEWGIEGDIERFLLGIQCLVINIPPKLRGEVKENYMQKIAHLAEAAQTNGVKYVIFVGSTSVYADSNTEITENTLPQPETESGRQLLASEGILKNNTAFKTTVLRFGGLYGDKRHPVKFLSGKKNLPNPDAPVNLIHLNDCIGIIKKILEKNAWGETFNAVHPANISKKKFYTQQAIRRGLLLPEFDETKPSKGKKIVPAKLIEMLSYQFQVDL